MLTETTLKLKPKVITFAGVSLFIGITQSLPTKISLLGLDLTNNPKALGWFILVMTMVLFIQFLVAVTLDCVMHFKDSIVDIKVKDLKSADLSMTHKDINETYDSGVAHGLVKHLQDQKEVSTSSEEDDLERQEIGLRTRFDKKHLTIRALVEFLFDVVLPVFLAGFGLIYLYSYLVIDQLLVLQAQ